MTTTVTIGAPTLAGHPVWLTANGVRRLHHQQHARYVRHWLDLAMWQIKADRIQASSTPVRIDVHVKRSSAQRLDCDGVAPTAKVCIDALVKCGILPDDGPRFVREITYHAETSRADVDWLRLTITEATP